ncbi:MAG: VOC family protein [Planctomycetota bacterium]
MPALRHHAINYIEFAVTDMAATRAFFHAAFGWEFNEYGPEYTGIRQMGEEGEVGGLRLESEVKPGGALVILYSEDLEASLTAVESAGGRISAPIFAFPGGRRFQFLDPDGNELAVWSDQ